jgi:hypothetical protein
MRNFLLISLLSSFIIALGDNANAITVIKPDIYEDLTQQCNNPLSCTVEEKVRILNLPEEPDKEINNSTILGVDIEGSLPLVRDDIERKIGIIFFNDSQARGIYNRQAELWSLILINKDKPDVLNYIDEYRKNLNCELHGFIKEFNGTTLEEYHLNTSDRYLEFTSIFNKSGYKFYNLDKLVVKTYCESFK